MRLFLALFILSGTLNFFAQSGRLNNALKLKLLEKDSPGEVFTILVQGDVPRLSALQQQGDYRINYSAGNIASVKGDATAIAFLLEHHLISYAEWSDPRSQPLNDTMVHRNRIQAVKSGLSPLSQAYDGSGIVIGFIDTGIDIAHGDFKDAQGNSRIRFLWDQKASSGPVVPAPFGYGIEWTDADINANQCTHSDMAFYGHGTHVAGVAAGNGLANHTHEGCAPEADIVMVAMDFNHNGPANADAVQYILDKAALLGKPCVINASVGNYYGSHDGTDLEAKLIDNLLTSAPGRVMVAAVGNGGHIRHHVQTSPSGNDTSFTWLRNSGTQLHYWFYGDTSQVRDLRIGVGANRSNFSDLGRIAFKGYNDGLSLVQQDTLKHQGNRIGIVYHSASINNYGVYERYIHIKADSSLLLWRVETTGNGLHHAWNFDFVSSGLPSPAQYPAISHYATPDTLYSMVSSFQCSDEVITVANYVNLSSFYDVHDTLRHTGETTGALAYSSSSGPTRDLRQKPDIAASGQGILSALVTGMQSSQVALSPTTVAQGSLHVLGGGSSAASPIVAGLAALYLQAHPEATNRQVKSAIIQCAYADAFTGTLPNYAWGHGKLDGLAAMVCGEDLVGINAPASPLPARYYPNPFREQVTIEFPGKDTRTISVYNTSGALIFEDQCSDSHYTLPASQLPGQRSTLLLVKVTGTSGHSTFKLIYE